MKRKLLAYGMAAFMVVGLFGCSTVQKNNKDHTVTTTPEVAEQIKTNSVSASLPPVRSGNIAIYHEGEHVDLQLGMPLEEATAALKSIGYDSSHTPYNQWRSHGSEYISYDTFSIQTLTYFANGMEHDYVAWIYVKSSDYQTNKGLRPGAYWNDVLQTYGPQEHFLDEEKHGSLFSTWPLEPFEQGVGIYDWKRDDYYFFAVEHEGRMLGYGIALESLLEQQETFLINKSKDTVLYENKIAGFSVELPGSWDGYYRSFDDENGSYFFYARQAYDGHYADMFSLNNGDGFQEDSIIQAGTAHGRPFISTTSTDASLSILEGWDLNKAETMMQDRIDIASSFKEIAVDLTNSDHYKEWLVNNEAMGEPNENNHAAMSFTAYNIADRNGTAFIDDGKWRFAVAADENGMMCLLAFDQGDGVLTDTAAQFVQGELAQVQASKTILTELSDDVDLFPNYPVYIVADVTIIKDSEALSAYYDHKVAVNIKGPLLTEHNTGQIKLGMDRYTVFALLDKNNIKRTTDEAVVSSDGGTTTDTAHFSVDFDRFGCATRIWNIRETTTQEGLKAGDSIDKIISVYGEQYKSVGDGENNALEYDQNKCYLYFNLDHEDVIQSWSISQISVTG